MPMISFRKRLLKACTPLAHRHALVEGHVPNRFPDAAANTRHASPCAAPARANAHVVRLFAVQIR
jgi:hypothetical protein